MEEVKGTKLIGIGNEGIKKLEEVESKIVEKIDTEKTNTTINKDTIIVHEDLRNLFLAFLFIKTKQINAITKGTQI